MGEGQMMLGWSRWPKTGLGQSQEDPIEQKELMYSFRHAVARANLLREEFGENLIRVDLTIRLVG